MANKVHTLFVGSFVEAGKAGNVGGQWYACRSLLRSPLSDSVEWILLDTTAPSNYHIPVWRRGLRALGRMIRFVLILVFRRVDSVLLFTSNGNSFREKGTMALIARRFGKTVVIAPRAGRLLDELRDEKKKAFIGKVFTAVDAVVCQSEGWKANFKNAFPHLSRERWVVIRNWIEMNELPDARQKSASPVVTLMYMGAIEKAKGVFDLADACELLLRQTKQFRVLLGGDGKDMNELKERVEAKGLASFFEYRGWVTGESKTRLLQDADVFILPSYYEGSPNSLKEAMGSGIASIGTTVGAIPEIIDEGLNGFIIAPGDSEALCHRLLALIQQPELRSRLAAAGIEKIRKAHSVDMAAAALLTLLSQSRKKDTFKK
jgi:glycosyltransferase involved in cell wall biosynthesis